MALKPDISSLPSTASTSDNSTTDVVESHLLRNADESTANAERSVSQQTNVSNTTTADKEVVADSNSHTDDLLPTTLTPTHYNLHLHPHLEERRDNKGRLVDGMVAVDLRVNQSTDQIVLHTKTISIHTVTVYNGTIIQEEVTVADNVNYDLFLETATIQLQRKLTPDMGNNVRLEIKFTGELSDSMYGLYRCRYRDRSGQHSHMLVTQFQAKYARLVFPCWDEPAIKARFTLSLTVPLSHTPLSNMPVVRSVEHPEDNLQTVHFAKSPLMSTYLLAIVSGELEYKEGVSMAGEIDSHGKRQPVKCRIYTPPADVNKVQFSLDTAVTVLEKLVDLFGSAYPLPKLDLVAVPELEAGGMENWGLVLFRTMRLFITAQTSMWIRQKAVYVIAHELSHQWFGNLVTMAWWDDLWLNEGFATWIGIFISDKLYPKWRRWDFFTIEDRQAALSSDSLRSSHPVQVAIKGSDDIDQVFDSITYYKGCALIRMLSAHLGIDVFMAGVREYLQSHQYGSATTKDLWRALRHASGMDVESLMRCWTTKVGYPVILVDEDFKTGTMCLRQSRYLNSGVPGDDEDQAVWWVPLGIISSHTLKDEPDHTALCQRQSTIDIPGGTKARWFKLNCENAGLYRVCYSKEALARLSIAIQNKELRAVDTVGILNDMVALVTSGYTRTSVLLDMIADCFSQINEYSVWQIISCFLEALHTVWADRNPTVRGQICQLISNLFSPMATELGWTHRAGDTPQQSRLRSISVPRAGWAGNQTVIGEACQLFEQFYNNPQDDKPFHHDYTTSIFEIAVRSGPSQNHARVKEMYENSQRWRLSEDHRLAALGAMGCTGDEDQMRETLTYALSDHVLPQDLNIIIGFMVTANFQSKRVLWRWLCQNYDNIVDRLGECSALLGIVVTSVIGDFSSAGMATEIETWFVDKRTAAFDRSLPQCMETIRVRDAWFQRDNDDVIEWFTNNLN